MIIKSNKISDEVYCEVEMVLGLLEIFVGVSFSENDRRRKPEDPESNGNPWTCHADV